MYTSLFSPFSSFNFLFHFLPFASSLLFNLLLFPFLFCPLFLLLFQSFLSLCFLSFSLIPAFLILFLLHSLLFLFLPFLLLITYPILPPFPFLYLLFHYLLFSPFFYFIPLFARNKFLFHPPVFFTSFISFLIFLLFHILLLSLLSPYFLFFIFSILSSVVKGFDSRVEDGQIVGIGKAEPGVFLFFFSHIPSLLFFYLFPLFCSCPFLHLPSFFFHLFTSFSLIFFLPFSPFSSSLLSSEFSLLPPPPKFC